MWFKKNKWKIIIPVLIIAVLAAAFFADRSGIGEEKIEAVNTVEESDKPVVDNSVSPSQTSDVSEITPAPTTEESKASSVPTPTAAPATAEPQISNEVKPSCTISVSCTTLLNNIDLLSEEKRELVPSNGWILATTVTFSEGESVFDVLKQTLTENGIHLEFVDTPAYKSAYIEGIGNLYEFDAGTLSGWMYRVNGVFPNYGSSRYTLQNGDVIEWLYTCDLGADVGGNNNYSG